MTSPETWDDLAGSSAHEALVSLTVLATGVEDEAEASDARCGGGTESDIAHEVGAARVRDRRLGQHHVVRRRTQIDGRGGKGWCLPISPVRWSPLTKAVTKKATFVAVPMWKRIVLLVRKSVRDVSDRI